MLTFQKLQISGMAMTTIAAQWVQGATQSFCGAD